ENPFVKTPHICPGADRSVILSASTADEMHQTRKRLRCSAERFRIRHRRCPKGKIGGRYDSFLFNRKRAGFLLNKKICRILQKDTVYLLT
ncbi:MAG: hypothetical protein IJS17_06370, partial [Clostridia bacterium]|nr:hypothetical protein [Clostridia bacterium]